MKIDRLIYLNRCLLVVFYTNSKCYQYSIASENNLIYTPQEIFYTAEEAYKVGLEQVKDLIKRL